MKTKISNFFDLFQKSNRKSPDILILGVQKGATSSIFYYLNQHPQVKGAKKKEVHFFDYDYNYSKGTNWYMKQFPLSFQNDYLLEATPSYLYYEKVAQRIKKDGHAVKFIVSFRNPLERAYSAWNMQRNLIKYDYYKKLISKLESDSNRLNFFLSQQEFPSFDELTKREIEWISKEIDIKEPSLLRRGFYEDQLNIWFNYFDKEQFFFLQAESLRTEEGIKYHVEQICKFCGLEENKEYLDNLKLDGLNQGKYNSSIKTVVSLENRTKLNNLFKDRNRNLEKLTGLEFSWLK